MRRLAPPPARLPAALLLFAPLALAACQGGVGDPDVVADRLAEAAAANFADIRDFTITGEGLVAYFTRTGPDSLFAFDSRAFTDDSLRQPAALSYHLPNAMQLARGLRGNARLAGTAELDGARVYVLEASDPGVLLGDPTGRGGLDSVRVYVDAETFFIREIRLVEPPADSATTPLVTRQRYEDFRTAGGLTLPFRTSTIISGIAIPEEVRLVRGGMLELQRRQAQALPPAARERALREIEQEMRLIQEGVMEETFTVDAVRVNTGAPPSLPAPPVPAPPDTTATAP